ncbi:MAG: VTT domain-containing protein, partial [Promethearchaeota archaeon]
MHIGSYKIKKIDWFLIIFLAIILILTPIILTNPDFAQNFDINKWFGSENYENMNYWAIIGFLIVVSILGALVPIPIPYIIPAAVIASVYYDSTVIEYKWVKIVGIIFLAALGNSIGDFLDYIIGNGAGRVMEKDQPNLTDKWSQRILKKPKAIPWIIVAFGLTPLPDSLLLTPLGLVKYPIKKTLFWMYVGKVGMFLIVIIAGIFGIDPILKLLGEGGGDSGSIAGIILLYLMWVIIALMAKWDAIFKKKDILPE